MIHERPVALAARDGIVRPAREWRGEAAPWLILVVAHGMGEHAARYREPLTPLIEDGVAVFSLEHRGHGEDAVAAGTQGDYGPGLFAGLVADLHALVDAARAAHPDVPLVLLGHSMGSMIAQGYFADHTDALDGLVLSGAIAIDRVPPGGGDASALIAALNAPFAPARTEFDWLSRDEDQVDRYIADPLCGFGLTEASANSIVEAAPRIAAAPLPADLPVYIFSGEQDPLHLVLDGWRAIGERYRAAGLDVTERLYEGGRHEMLNETNRAEVVRDLATWLERFRPR